MRHLRYCSRHFCSEALCPIISQDVYIHMQHLDVSKTCLKLPVSSIVPVMSWQLHNPRETPKISNKTNQRIQKVETPAPPVHGTPPGKPEPFGDFVSESFFQDDCSLSLAPLAGPCHCLSCHTQDDQRPILQDTAL